MYYRKHDLTRYIRSRMGVESKCTFCNQPIFDDDYLHYTKRQLSNRTFYSFYHAKCWDELLRVEHDYQEYLRRGYPDE